MYIPLATIGGGGVLEKGGAGRGGGGIKRTLPMYPSRHLKNKYDRAGLHAGPRSEKKKLAPSFYMMWLVGL